MAVMGCVVLPCDCKSEYQDKQYGVGKRVHNMKTKPNDKAVCTVCSKERSA